ncbi:hypothetical protein E1200_30670 [Actinomadura sp. GC306]|nr:hypothetical protein E1200_30670 [Actinomadura sp. GC306]
MLVVVVVLVIVLRDGEEPAAPVTRETPSPSPSTAEPARFATAPSPCGLITAEQAGELVRTFHNHADERPDSDTGVPRKECVWQTSATAEGDERLWLTLRTAASTAAARGLLAEEQAGAIGETTALPDFGAGAFAANGSDGASRIYFGVGNLVADIRYVSGRGRQDELALRAARWAHTSLERS